MGRLTLIGSASMSGVTLRIPFRPFGATTVASRGPNRSAPTKQGRSPSTVFAQWMPFDGGAALAWLDGRDFDENPDPAIARMEVRLARWLSDRPWSEETVLDSSVCTCCPMATLAHPSGPVELVYRDRLPGEIRDFNRILVEPSPLVHFMTLGRSSANGWEIAACPVNGASLSQNAERTLAVWFTATEDTARVRLAWREVGSVAFGAPHDLHQSPPLGRVTSATDQRGILLRHVARNQRNRQRQRGWVSHGMPKGQPLIPLLCR